MLFHITHTHTAENCSAHQPERQATFAKMMKTAPEYGAKLHGVYADALAHTIFILLEIDDAMQLTKMFDPVLEYGHYTAQPVTDAFALLKQMQGE